MRPQSCIVVALATSIPLLSACSANHSIPAPSTVAPMVSKAADAGWLSPEAKHGALLYVGDFRNNNYAVLIYKLGGRRPIEVGRLTGGIFEPQNLWVDKQGTLYIVTYYPADLVIYPPGQKFPSQTLEACPSTCGVMGFSVTTDSTGLIYFGTSVFSNFGGIIEYEPGNPNPVRVIKDDVAPFGLAVDKSDNLYASNGAGDVLKYAPGATSGTPLGLQGLVTTSDVAFDKAGDLVVGSNEAGATTYFFFKPGATTAFRTLKPIVNNTSIAFDPQGNLYAQIGGTGPNNGAVELLPRARDKNAHLIIRHIPGASGIAIGPLIP